MAAFNNIGSLLRQGALKNGVFSAPLPAVLNSVRYVSSNRIFVGGLSFGTDNEALKEAFSGFGHITYASVVMNRETKSSRGFGFVTFSNDEDAKAAVSSMDGLEVHGRNLTVRIATDAVGGSRGSYRPVGGGGGGFGGKNSGSGGGGSSGSGGGGSSGSGGRDASLENPINGS